MLAINLAHTLDRPLRVLCLGAHCDDIEIGCGGTVLRLMQAYPDAAIDWVVFTGDARRRAEAEASAAAFFTGVRNARLQVHSFRDGFLPFIGEAVKNEFERLKENPPPDLIFTHYRDDLHQDHRLIAQLTYNTFRDHLILEYEIPKYDGDLGNPSVFVPLDEQQTRRKLEIILDAFPSQRSKPWFVAETFTALLRLRGVACNAASGYAEGFYSRKLVAFT